MSKNENLSLEVFDNPEFGQMRILREGDKYLFCANDAAVALGYANPRAALQRHCKGVAKRDTLLTLDHHTTAYWDLHNHNNPHNYRNHRNNSGCLQRKRMDCR